MIISQPLPWALVDLALKVLKNNRMIPPEPISFMNLSAVHITGRDTMTEDHMVCFLISLTNPLLSFCLISN